MIVGSFEAIVFTSAMSFLQCSVVILIKACGENRLGAIQLTTESEICHQRDRYIQLLSEFHSPMKVSMKNLKICCHKYSIRAICMPKTNFGIEWLQKNFSPCKNVFDLLKENVSVSAL